MRKHIPNFITLLNLLAGCLAVVAIVNNQLVVAASLVFLAAVLDFLDGAAARMLNVKSPIGKELDSLADVVSFGLVPGLLLFSLIRDIASFRYADPWFLLLAYSALLIPLFSALRLAKFNIDETQTYYFKGLPTPACALYIASLPFILQNHSHWTDAFSRHLFSVLADTYSMSLQAVLLSALLVVNVPLFSMKFSALSWKGNELRYLFLLIAVGLVSLLSFLAIPLLLILYILLSVIGRKFILKEEKGDSVPENPKLGEQAPD